jgi:hypothetical protein
MGKAIFSLIRIEQQYTAVIFRCPHVYEILKALKYSTFIAGTGSKMT